MGVNGLLINGDTWINWKWPIDFIYVSKNYIHSLHFPQRALLQIQARFFSDNWPRIDQALMWMAFSNHGRFGGCWLLKLTRSSYLIPTLVGVLLRLAKDVPFISLRVGPQMWRVPKGKIKARMEAAHTLDKHKQKIQYPPQNYWSLKRYASSWLMSCRNQSSGCCVTQLTSLTSHHFIVCHISNISSFVTLEPFHAYESNQFWWLQHSSFRHIIALRNFLDTFKGPRWIDDGWVVFSSGAVGAYPKRPELMPWKNRIRIPVNKW